MKIKLPWSEEVETKVIEWIFMIGMFGAGTVLIVYPLILDPTLWPLSLIGIIPIMFGLIFLIITDRIIFVHK